MRVLLLPILIATLQAQAPPDPAQLQQLISRARTSAMRFEGRLPDFSCTKTTVRWEDSSGSGKKWKLRDTLEESVSFASNGNTQMKLLRLDRTPITRDRKFLGGVVEDDLLRAAIVPEELFGEKAEAQFEWARWEMRQGRRIAVLRYYAKGFNYPDGKTRYELKITGQLYFDPASDEIVRIEAAHQGPPNYPFKDSGWEADFARVMLSDREIVLPIRGISRLTRGKGLYRNEFEFTNYRKYGADVVIHVDDDATR
jgi:hypothetical protein